MSLVAVALVVVALLMWGGALKQDSDSQVGVVLVGNPEQIRHPDPEFRIGRFDDPAHQALREGRVLPGMNAKWGPEWREADTWSQATMLRIWVRDYLDFGLWSGDYDGREYVEELYRVEEMLAWRDEGNDGLCSYYATFYMHCANGIGIYARRAGWWHPDLGGDELVEVYVPELRKWAALSPLYNMWFSLDDDIPLSLRQLHELVDEGRANQVIEHRDGTSTQPDGTGLAGGHSVVDLAYSVHYRVDTGAAFDQGSAVYDYADSGSEPRVRLGGRILHGPDALVWDVGLIRLGEPNLHGNVLTIPIEDCEMPNGAFIEIGVRYDDRRFERLVPFPADDLSVTLDSTETTISVTGVNSAGGRTNTVVVAVRPDG